jgi:hypothetical protein
VRSGAVHEDVQGPEALQYRLKRARAVGQALEPRVEQVRQLSLAGRPPSSRKPASVTLLTITWSSGRLATPKSSLQRDLRPHRKRWQLQQTELQLNRALTQNPGYRARAH